MISANISSTVYKNASHVYEVLSVDMRYQNENTKSPYVQFAFLQAAEIQAFDFDDDGNFILEPSDWHVKENAYHPNTSRSDIGRRIDILCHKAKIGFDDVRLSGAMSHICVMTRNGLENEFGREVEVENIEKAGDFLNLHIELSKRMHPDVFDLMLEYFAHEFKEIRAHVTNTKHLRRSDTPKRKATPKPQQEGTYEHWGAFS